MTTVTSSAGFRWSLIVGTGLALGVAGLAAPTRAEQPPTPQEQFDAIRQASLDKAKAVGGRTQRFRAVDVSPMRYTASLRWQGRQWLTRFEHKGVTYKYLDSRYLYTAFRGYPADGAGTSRVQREFLRVNGLGGEWGTRSRSTFGQEANLEPNRDTGGSLGVTSKGDRLTFFDGSGPAYPDSLNIAVADRGLFRSESHYSLSGPFWFADYTYGKVARIRVPRNVVSEARLRRLGYDDTTWLVVDVTQQLRGLVRKTTGGFGRLTNGQWRRFGRQVDVVGRRITPRVALNQPQGRYGSIVTLVWRNRPGSVSAVLHLCTTRGTFTRTGQETRVRSAR